MKIVYLPCSVPDVFVAMFINKLHKYTNNQCIRCNNAKSEPWLMMLSNHLFLIQNCVDLFHSANVSLETCEWLWFDNYYCLYKKLRTKGDVLYCLKKPWFSKTS